MSLNTTNLPTLQPVSETFDEHRLGEAVKRASLQSSPVNLSSNLNNLSLSGGALSMDAVQQQQQQQQQQESSSQHQQHQHQSQQASSQHQHSQQQIQQGQQSQQQLAPELQQQQQQQLPQHQQDSSVYTLKIKNAPSDISLRESYCIFALAKDFIGLELAPDSNNLPVIFAKFRSLAAASTYSQMLESNQVFGPTYPFNLKTEIIDAGFPPNLNLGISSKRPSIGNHRSRFLFTDPFSNDTISESVEPTQQPQNGSGKSLLMMEAQQDAREYEQFVRDPWALQQSSSQPGSTVSLSASQYLSPQPQTPGVEWDRRIQQGSTFFANPSPLLTSQLGASHVQSQLSLNQIAPQLPPSTQGLPPGLNQHGNVGVPPQSAPVSQQLSSSSSTQQPGSQQSQQQSQQQQQSQPIVQQQPSSSSQHPQSQGSSQTLQSSSSTISNRSSQVDLSLLARVPPPANPADQNPPCNTLYVGNLPPDATEAELRQLFSPQRGFRRLSFRTKQSNGSSGSGSSNHAHGPMCFVEFEDIAYATRALAELYGRTLPRPGGVTNKGGIRLSFSKNPLGVRGPGQRRTSAFNYQNGFKS